MRGLIIVGAVVLACGCEAERGVLLTVVISPRALAAAAEVVVVLESTSGSLTTVTEEHSVAGAVVESRDGRVEIRFPDATFGLRPEFTVILVPSGRAPRTVTLAGSLLRADGQGIGGGARQGPVTLSDSALAEVTLELDCAEPACRPVLADLARPPSSLAMVTITGPSDDDQLAPLTVGRFLAPGGGDLVAAAPRRGQAFVFGGFDSAAAAAPRALDVAQADVTITAPAGEWLGQAAAAGDFDGDGIDDLALTAINARNPAGAPGAGVVYLLRGSYLRAQPAVDLATAPPDEVMQVYGGQAQERLGYAVALAPVAAAGSFDLVVGAPCSDCPEPAAAGRVYVVLGGRALPPTVLVGEPGVGAQDATILGRAGAGQLGLALAVGPLAADSSTWVAVGSPLEDGGNGAVDVVAGGRLVRNGVIALGVDPSDMRVTGVNRQQLGGALAIADLDGGGIGQLVVGTRQGTAAYVVDAHLDGSTLAVAGGGYMLAIEGPSGSAFGSVLAGGDLDGDGRADLVIGAPTLSGPDGTRPGAGGCFVVLGSQLPAFAAGSTWSVAAAPAALAIHGADRSDRLCDRIVLGDFDRGDALDELILGASRAAGGGRERGVIYAIQSLPPR